MSTIKKLDLNALEQPSMELTLLDEDRTTLHLLCPSTKLVDRFIAASKTLKAVQNSEDSQTICKLYELTAEVLSCNLEGVNITAEDLRDKYKVQFVHLIFIFNDYLGFIHELNNAKN